MAQEHKHAIVNAVQMVWNETFNIFSSPFYQDEQDEARRWLPPGNTQSLQSISSPDQLNFCNVEYKMWTVQKVVAWTFHLFSWLVAEFKDVMVKDSIFVSNYTYKNGILYHRMHLILYCTTTVYGNKTLFYHNYAKTHLA